jgi:cystathionine beta-synthase
MSVSIDHKTEILPSILDAIGETPCVHMDRLAKHLGLDIDLVGKCEFMNPGGSVKDRIGLQMVLDAEAEGRIKKGDTLVEATSGNTGIAMSMTAATRGYHMIITMPVKMSHEKQTTLQVLGAHVIRTPSSVAHDHPDSLISVAKRLVKEHPETHHMLDQYRNMSNPKAHYEGTGAEILRQCGGKVDYIFLTTGTGGTMSGVARALKEKIPGVKVIGVDPVGSLLADPSVPAPNTPYQVEGIGYDFVPDVCDRSLVDAWVKTEDKESFARARDIIKCEGMLVGGSCGSVIAAVVKYAPNLPKGARVVVVLPDGIRNYMSKYADDNWMIEKGYATGEITRPTYDSLAAENAKLRAELEKLKGTA